MKDFSKASQTVAGYEVKGVTFNTMAGCYIGKVADPVWSSSNYVSASWDKNGKCKNQTRADCDLKL